MSEESSEDIIKKIATFIEETTIREVREERAIFTPEMAERYRRILSAWYSRYIEEIAVLEPKTDEYWLDIREENGSDKVTDKKVSITEDGKRLRLIKARVKYIEKLIAGLRDHLRMLENDYWNALKT